ncbi:MAG: class I SAM-dependent methyltransferase [Alphaproteobacteria bacterium]
MTSWQSYKNLYRAHGLKRVWTHIRETSLFDWRYGVDTGTWMPLSEYSNTDADMKHYQASFTGEIKRCFTLLRSLCDTASYTFFDIGCGKGKVLILAAQHLPCRGITGVELDHGLAETARRNLEIRSVNGHVVEVNARDFREYAPRSIVYICDPFGEETLHAMLEQITQHCDECYLIYNNPAYAAEPFGFHKIRETGGWHANYRTVIYHFKKDSL